MRIIDTMALAQELTETPEWTAEEETMCAKILTGVQKGEIKIHRLR